MTLQIISNEEYDEYFVRWLISEISIEIISNVNNPKLLMYDKITETNLLFPLEKTVIKFGKAIIYGAKNLIFTKSKDKWIISIDNNLTYPKTSIKIITLCKIANNGFLGLKGTNIFTQVFNSVSANLTKYYNMYMMEM